MFRESVASVPEEVWAHEPEEADEIALYQTGDWRSMMHNIYPIGDEVDFSFPIEDWWVQEAMTWMIRNLNPLLPLVLLHIPTIGVGSKPTDECHARFCDTRLFCDLYERYSGRVRFFDVRRDVEDENYPIANVPMPVMQSDCGKVGVLWAMAALADAIVTTDNHMLPIALAMGRPTLYLAGSVPISYLFDERINRSKVVIVPQSEPFLLDRFDEVLEMV